MRSRAKIGIVLAIAAGAYAAVRTGVARNSYDSLQARMGGSYALCRAINMNRYGFAVKYVQAGTKIESMPRELYGVVVAGEQPLVEACRSSWCDNAFLLLKHGAKVNVVDSAGNTPLHMAAQERSPRLIQALIDRGADVNAVNKDFRTPLDMATAWNAPSGEGTLLLIKRGGRLKNPGTDSVAATSGNRPLMSKERSLALILYRCFRSCSDDTIMAFLRKGADLKFKSSRRPYSLLGEAIEQNRSLEIIEAMLKQGADPNETFDIGSINMPAIHYACQKGDPDLVRLLIKYGGNPNLKDAAGDTPLDIVARAQGAAR